MVRVYISGFMTCGEISNVVFTHHTVIASAKAFEVFIVPIRWYTVSLSTNSNFFPELYKDQLTLTRTEIHPTNNIVLVWLSALLLVLLRESSSSKGTGSDLSYRRLKSALVSHWQLNVFEIFYWKRSKLPQCNKVDNRQIKLTAPTAHCTLPFCIVRCSMHLVGSDVAEHDLVFEFDDD